MITMHTRLFRAAVPAAGGVALAALLGATGPAWAQVPDPPGNNGTVKVDGVEFDEHPDNQPHVGCEFQIDFAGFDEGEDLNATITFAVVPPTGDDILIENDELFIGDDPAGGAVDNDASKTYDLTDLLAAFTPHPQQGWHVKLTVHAEGSIGADTKYKVFWVTGCEVPPTTAPSSSTTSSSSTSSSSTTSSSTTVPGSTTSTSKGEESTTTTVVGPTTPGGPGGTTPEGELPRTGSDSVPVALGALALVGLGAAGLLAARHLRTAGEQ